MSKKIILSTGGTGGHVFPMIAFYEYLVSKNYEVIFITDQRARKYFNKESNSALLKPMKYGTLSGGKKIRSSIIINTGKLFSIEEKKLSIEKIVSQSSTTDLSTDNKKSDKSIEKSIIEKINEK